MLPCVYVDGRDTGADYPSALVAPEVPSGTPPTGRITRDGTSAPCGPHPGMRSQYKQRPCRGRFLCGFVFILDLGVSSLSKGVSPHSPQPYPDPT